MAEPLQLHGRLSLSLPPGGNLQVRINHAQQGCFATAPLPHLTLPPGCSVQVLQQEPDSFALELFNRRQEPHVALAWWRSGVAAPHIPSPPYWTERADPPTAHLLEAEPEKLHVLCPAGVGDFLWIWSKWASVAAARPVKFWFPEGEQHRAGQYAQLVGADHSYLPGLWTEWVWNRPGDPPIPAGPGVLSVHANFYLENGWPLRDWYPDLPLQIPQPRLPARRPGPYRGLLAFCCHEGYMEGNLEPAQWGEIFTRLHAEIGPVTLVGAGRDVPYGEAILAHYPDAPPPVFDRPFTDLLRLAQKSRAMVGLAGGPMIAALNLGCPAFLAYPTWLARMPGSWEPAGVRWDSCLTFELPQRLTPAALRPLLR